MWYIVFQVEREKNEVAVVALQHSKNKNSLKLKATHFRVDNSGL